jgi:hypothetical protein
MAGKGGKTKGAGRRRGSVNKLTAENRATLSALARGHTEECLNALLRIVRKSDHDMAVVKAVEAIWNRGYGLPVQPIEGADGGPVQVQIVKYADSPAAK